MQEPKHGLCRRTVRAAQQSGDSCLKGRKEEKSQEGGRGGVASAKGGVVNPCSLAFEFTHV